MVHNEVALARFGFSTHYLLFFHVLKRPPNPAFQVGLFPSIVVIVDFCRYLLNRTGLSTAHGHFNQVDQICSVKAVQISFYFVRKIVIFANIIIKIFTMAFEIQNLKASDSRKRFDLDVLVKPWWIADWSFKLRILARQEISDAQLKDIVQQVIDRKGEWRTCKANSSIQLNGYNANAFIINEANKTNSDEQRGTEESVQ